MADSWISGLDLLHSEQAVTVCSSGCASIDHILGGGIRSHEVTEFCGIPGSGKSQLGMQFAVTIQLPVEFGGAGGSCVVVGAVAYANSNDTEGSLRAARVLQVAEQRLQHFAAQLPAGQAMPMTATDLVAGVHRCRVHDAAQLVAACITLAAEVPPQVKAVVVDSVAAPFRMVEGMQWQHQSAMLGMIGRMLRRLAARGIAVVVMNQVVGGPSGGNSDVKPALGAMWSSQPTHRVMLAIQDGTRKARIMRSPSLPADEAEFCISDVGLTG